MFERLRPRALVAAAFLTVAILLAFYPALALVGPERALLSGRQSSYNPKTALGASLVAWWDASPKYWGGVGAIAPAGGGTLTSWTDIVGGYSAVQSGCAATPVWSATSFAGTPGVTADGSSQCLYSTTAGLLAALPSGGNASEIWILWQEAGTSGNRFMASYGNTLATARSVGATNTTTRRAAAIIGTGSNPAITGTIIDVTGARTVSRVQIGASTTIQTVNGVVDPATPLAAVPTTTVSRVGLFTTASVAPAQFGQGTLKAVLFLAPLTASQAAPLQTWMMGRRNGD